MNRLRFAIAFLAVAAPAAAAQTPQVTAPESPGARFVPAPPGVTYGERAPGYVEEPITAERPTWRGEPRPVAVLRALDKVSGRVTDLKVPVGGAAHYERLTIEALDCREPPEGEAEDAFVFLKILDAKLGEREVFSGWMFASSPALSAMDHQRYDVWALSCATS